MIPNISIKIKPSILDGVLFLFDQDAFKKPSVHLKPPLRAMASILFPLSRKLILKQHEWKQRDVGSKAYKLKMSYHEAYALYSYIHGMRETIPLDSYERNACNMIHATLNQELQ